MTSRVGVTLTVCPRADCRGAVIRYGDGARCTLCARTPNANDRAARDTDSWPARGEQTLYGASIIRRRPPPRKQACEMERKARAALAFPALKN